MKRKYEHFLKQTQEQEFRYLWSGPAINEKGVMKCIMKLLLREDINEVYQKKGFIIVSSKNL